MTPILWWYLGAVNLLALVLAASDKQRARCGYRRIPEKTLLFIAAGGGAALMLCAMHLFHHKTRKPKFFIGVPCLMLLHIGLLVIAYLKGFL